MERKKSSTDEKLKFLQKKNHATYPTQLNCHMPIDSGAGTIRPFEPFGPVTVVQFRGTGT